MLGNQCCQAYCLKTPFRGPPGAGLQCASPGTSLQFAPCCLLLSNTTVITGDDCDLWDETAKGGISFPRKTSGDVQECSSCL